MGEHSQQDALELVQTWLPDKKHVDLDPLGPQQKHFLFTLRMYLDEDRFRPSQHQIKYLFDLHEAWSEATKVVRRYLPTMRDLTVIIMIKDHSIQTMSIEDFVEGGGVEVYDKPQTVLLAVCTEGEIWTYVHPMFVQVPNVWMKLASAR